MIEFPGTPSLDKETGEQENGLHKQNVLFHFPTSYKETAFVENMHLAQFCGRGGAARFYQS